MTYYTCRRFTAVAGLAAIGAAIALRYARAAEFTFKLGTNVPESHPLNVYARMAAEEIKAGDRRQIRAASLRQQPARRRL